MANADRIIELLHEAKAQPAGAERERFLAEACRDDAALMEQIASLLEADADEGESDFLKIKQILRPVILPTEKPGDRIGRYKLLEQIGEGGCGVVYMAEQEDPVRRRVALKVIKLGMDTKQVIARFEAERQALAMMDHPNIAKVLDAGTTEAPHPVPLPIGWGEGGRRPGEGSSEPQVLSAGRPYFVMELVRGIKITDYCDQNNLSTNERLELFIQVCQAIQHAHQKGIIHRDIKPSNILVTLHDDVAVPKVIDFGIAKATVGQLTDKTVFTAFAQFIGTPAYMSPEQAQMSGLDVDTRADIYSLGVLLYELLTGHTPFDAKELLAAGMDEMRRKIREEEPAKPSTRLSTMQAMELTTVAKRRHAEPPRLIHLIRGDLDWLVMKCLEKDRTRRYETANGLAADIQRHLNNEPVTACPPSRWYEFQKTVRRHKFGFAAAAALVCVLALGVLASTWQALRATRAEREQIKLREEADVEKRTAQTEAAKSQQVAQFMQDMLKGVGPSAALGRDTTMLREILDKTAQRIAEDLKTQPEVEAEMRNSMGIVYWELGEFDKAAEMHRQALTMQRKLVGYEHPSVATSLHHLARALREQGKRVESEATFRESLTMRKKLLGGDHAEVARSMNDLASLLSGELKDGEPETLLREALAIRRRLYGREHPDVARSLDDLAYVINRHGQVNEAVAMHYEALAIRKKTLGENHLEVIYSYRNLARALEAQGNPTEAEKMLRAALSVCQKLLGNQHPEQPGIITDLANLIEAQGRRSEADKLRRRPGAASPTLALSLHQSGDYLHQQGKLAEAEANYSAALALSREQHGDAHQETVNTLGALGLVLFQERKLAEAEEIYRAMLTAQRRLAGDQHPRTSAILHQLGVVLHESNQGSEAEKYFREAIALRTKWFGRENGEVADSMVWLGIAIARQGRHAEAETLMQEGLLIGRKIPTWENWVANALLILSYELRDLGKLSEAVTAAREAVAIRRELFGSGHLELAHAMRGLSLALSQSGQAAEAEALAREELAMRRNLLGDEHLDVAHALSHLTWLLRNQNNLGAAETSARELLALQEKLLGPTNPETAETMRNLAEVLTRQNKFIEAKTFFLKAAEHANPHVLNEIAFLLATAPSPKLRDGPVAVTAAEKAVAGTNRKNPLIVDTLAAAYAEVGQFKKAVEIQQEANAMLQDEKQRSGFNERLKLYESGLPYRDHGQLAAMTKALLDELKPAEAEPLARECLALRQVLIPDDWRTFNARSMLGGSLLGQKKYAEAEPLLLSGYEGMKLREDKIPANGKPRLKETLQRLVQLYEAKGQSENAAEWNRKLTEFDQAEAEKKAAVPKP